VPLPELVVLADVEDADRARGEQRLELRDIDRGRTGQEATKEREQGRPPGGARARRTRNGLRRIDRGTPTPLRRQAFTIHPSCHGSNACRESLEWQGRFAPLAEAKVNDIGQDGMVAWIRWW
jgi:hypothetical protein